MIINRSIKTLTLASLICFLACTQRSQNISNESLESSSIISIFAMRPSLGSKEYERFYIHKEIVFEECGKLSEHLGSNNEKEKQIPDNQIGRYTAMRKQIDARHLNLEQSRRIQHLSTQILKSIDQVKMDSLPSADVGSTGLFELVINYPKKDSSILLTSFDAIADKQEAWQHDILELYSYLRSLSDSKCGQEPFFGIR